MYLKLMVWYNGVLLFGINKLRQQVVMCVIAIDI